MTLSEATARSDTGTGRWARHGLIGGIAAGIVFALFEMIAAAVLMGTEAFFGPLREIGGILLGMQALDPGFPLITAAGVGLLTHLVLSAVYGTGFAVLVAVVPALRSSSMMLIGSATIVGLALWLVNFYVVAPVAGWTWFAMANPVVQFLAHAFFYGSVLGVYLDRVARQPERVA